MKGVAEALIPTPKFKSLLIQDYVDVELPSWIMRPSLTHLKPPLIWICTKCSYAVCLPLGELHFSMLQIQILVFVMPISRFV